MLIPFDIAESKETGFCITGTSGSGKTQLAKQLVRLLQLNGITTFVFDTSQAWLLPNKTPIEYALEFESPLRRETFNIQERNTVFDISRLEIFERFNFVNSICKGIMQNRINHPNLNSLNWLFLLFEESQLYLSNGCMRSLKKYGSILDVVTVGRNYKVRFGIITQFPANVDKAPIKITQQRYFGWTTEKNDVSYLKSFVTKDQEDELRTQLGIKDKRLHPLMALGKMKFVYQYQGKSRIFNIEPFGTVEKADSSFSYNFKPIYAT